MLFNAAFSLFALASAGIVVATPSALDAAGAEAIAACGETAARVCFGKEGGTSQDIEIEDIEYAAASLRFIGQSNTGASAFWTMPSGVDCEEWQLPVSFGGSVLSLGKHINPRFTSSVLYTDLADAIDGGEFATAAQKQASLLGCGRNGGMFGVKANTTNPAYSTDEYKSSKARPEGILVKLVRAPI